jgi:hypothetical protein
VEALPGFAMKWHKAIVNAFAFKSANFGTKILLNLKAISLAEY